MNSCLLFCSLYPFQKGISFKGKNLLPMGANSFLLKQSPFQKGDKNNADRVVSPKCVSISLKTFGTKLYTITVGFYKTEMKRNCIYHAFVLYINTYKMRCLHNNIRGFFCAMQTV